MSRYELDLWRPTDVVFKTPDKAYKNSNAGWKSKNVSRDAECIRVELGRMFNLSYDDQTNWVELNHLVHTYSRLFPRIQYYSQTIADHQSCTAVESKNVDYSWTTVGA